MVLEILAPSDIPKFSPYGDSSTAAGAGVQSGGNQVHGQDKDGDAGWVAGGWHPDGHRR